MAVTAQSVEDLEFHALRNALYHTARRQFLEGLSRWMNFLVIIGGATTVGQFLDTSGGAVWLGLAITIIGALQLVFDFAGRARTHEMLQRRYYELLGKIKEGGDLSDGERASIMGEIVRIAGDEPPTYRALDAIAYNEATDALYGTERAAEKCRIRWWQSLTRHLSHHNGTSFA